MRIRTRGVVRRLGAAALLATAVEVGASRQATRLQATQAVTESLVDPSSSGSLSEKGSATVGDGSTGEFTHTASHS